MDPGESIIEVFWSHRLNHLSVIGTRSQLQPTPFSQLMR
jgi:hypothetical protein